MENPIVHPSYYPYPKTLNTILGLLGMGTGAWVGYLGFSWVCSQGFYALVLPGFCIGLFTRLIVYHTSRDLQWCCAIVAFFFGFYTEWSFFPYIKDKSLFYFVNHLHQLKPITWIMIFLGSYVAYHVSKKYSSIPHSPISEDRNEKNDRKNSVE